MGGELSKLMTQRSYILDDGRKVRYYLNEWTNDETDTTYYVAEVSVYEKRRRYLTLGLTKGWKCINRETDSHVEQDEDALRECMEELRSIVLGDEERPLDKLLDSVLTEIEPNYETEEVK